MSGKFFFNAPIQLPKGSNIALENILDNKVYLNSNSSMASSYSLTLPSELGTTGQALVLNTNGDLTFDTISSSNVSSLASNAIVDSLSGDITFTTGEGNANIGTANGNTFITANGTIQIISNSTANNGIILSTNGNVISNVTGELSNINVLILDNVIGFNTPAFFQDTTESISSSVGAVTMRGGVAIYKNLNVGGNVSVTSNTTLNTLNITGSFITSINEFSDSTIATTDLWNGSNTATSKHILLTSASTSNYSSNALASTYTNGQTLNIFFTNASNGTANAMVDFGDAKLYSGSGLSQYLQFNTSGQSASLVYIDASVSNIDGWRIINTGASIL